ncbi:uncharacterized protein VTP21DRAFT_724 [Calcarisporiella thermophila]|uniref:uncharacterized protein n=1 Tax=Calcarisporiella thermophila TaxID=911321 RepID=UPI003742E8FB
MLGIECKYGFRKSRIGRRPNQHKLQYEQVIFDISNSMRIHKMYSRMLQPLILKFDQMFLAPLCEPVSPSHPISLWQRNWAQSLPSTWSHGHSIITNDMLSIIIHEMSSLNMGENVAKVFPRIANIEKWGIETQSKKLSRVDPLKLITFQHARNLIDIWFKIYAFPGVLSRAMMIQNFIEHRIDRFLYSVVFGYVLSKQISVAVGAVFIEFAMELLEHEMYEASLTKLQGIFILSGYLATIGEPKKSMSLLAIAWKMAKELDTHEKTNELPKRISNAVEKELLLNLIWAIRIVYTWLYMQCGSKIDSEIVKLKLKLPPKSPDESAIYTFEQKHDYSTSPREHSEIIRTFFNCAYLTLTFIELWLQIAPSSRGLSLVDPMRTNSEDYEISSQGETLSAKLARRIMELPANLDTENTVEILICLNVLIIHSNFQKLDANPLLYLEERNIGECKMSADAILNTADIILHSSHSPTLDPIVAFGLNSCACVYLILTEVDVPEFRDSALLYLRRVLTLLSSLHTVCHDQNLLQVIADKLMQAEQGPISLANTANVQGESAQLTLMSLQVPQLSLAPIANVKMCKMLSPKPTMVAIMDHGSKFSSSIQQH